MVKIRAFACAVVLGYFACGLKPPRSQHCLILHAALLAASCHRMVKGCRHTIYSICDQAGLCVAVEYVFERTGAEFMKRTLYWITTSEVELSERCGGYVSDETRRHIGCKGTML